ncbi:septum site-determining protein MinC [Alsobacter sp. R-9]
MSAQPKVKTAPRPALRFRGRSFLALSLAPQAPLDAWLADLDAWLERSPGFFSGRAVILDVAGAPMEVAALKHFITDLDSRGIRIMAVEGMDSGGLGLGLPPVIAHGRDAQVPPQAPAAPAPARGKALQADATTLFIEDPIRSGQSVFHPRGDVVVMGSVSSGAEIVAGGSIHVYGALRGRAIAGIAAQPGARIFCRRFEAELLAIDGLYKSADDIDPAVHGRAVSARIVEDALVVQPID